MKLIIPMAGRGSRLRPHTLTIPKPLIPIAGKPIVQRLVEDLNEGCTSKIDEVAFITGEFGEQVEKDLIQIAASIGAKGSIYYQDEPLGVGHAILCAKESMHGPCIVAFSDTLFKADFRFDEHSDGVIWVQKVEDPASFGVVKLGKNNVITEFVEKSPDFVSDLAIVGVYYFKDGINLREELQYLIDHNIKDKGEYQLTSALENMKSKGLQFKPGSIEEWLDCGNKDAVINTNKRMLELKNQEQLIADSAILEHSVLIPPCFVGENTHIRNSVIGPHVSIGSNSRVENAVIINSLIQNNSHLKFVNLENSMIGNFVEYEGKNSKISLGDYSNYSV
jgi:glucose-1-phosphate thymidylyltransferase